MGEGWEIEGSEGERENRGRGEGERGARGR